MSNLNLIAVFVIHVFFLNSVISYNRLYIGFLRYRYRHHSSKSTSLDRYSECMQLELARNSNLLLSQISFILPVAPFRSGRSITVCLYECAHIRRKPNTEPAPARPAAVRYVSVCLSALDIKAASVG